MKLQLNWQTAIALVGLAFSVMAVFDARTNWHMSMGMACICIHLLSLYRYGVEETEQDQED